MATYLRPGENVVAGRQYLLQLVRPADIPVAAWDPTPSGILYEPIRGALEARGHTFLGIGTTDGTVEVLILAKRDDRADDLIGTITASIKEAFRESYPSYEPQLGPQSGGAAPQATTTAPAAQPSWVPVLVLVGVGVALWMLLKS